MSNIYERVMNLKNYKTQNTINCYFYDIKKHLGTIIPDKSHKYIILFNLITDQVIWKKRGGMYIKYPFLLRIKVRKFINLQGPAFNFHWDDYSHVADMKGTDHRVLFQSADGTINMGVCFNDPDVEIYDIFWFNEITMQMTSSLNKNEGLISIDEELQIRSCYVELHRNGELNSIELIFQKFYKNTIFIPLEAIRLDWMLKIILSQWHRWSFCRPRNL